MKKIILFLSCLPGTVSAMAQITKIEFTPPSSASLMKETDYPVNSSNGIPEIRIPLQSMTSGNLVLNLDLNFNIESYIQPNQLPDSPGAGWSLNSDIQIIRQIRGEDDFGLHGYLSNPDIPSGYGLNDIITRSHDYKSDFYVYGFDEEPDKFYYRLLDRCGVFYFRKSSDGSFIPVCMPTDGTKISYHQTGQRQLFVIKDTDGTTYEYSNNHTDYEDVSGSAPTPPLAWKCDRIINAARTDSITFSYIQVTPSPVYGYMPTGIDVYDDYESADILSAVTPPVNNAAMSTTPVFVNCPYGPDPAPDSPDVTPPDEGTVTAPSPCTIVNPKYTYNTVNPLVMDGTSILYVYDGSPYNQFFRYIHPEPQNAVQIKRYHLNYLNEIRFRSGSIKFEYASGNAGILEQITVRDISGNIVKTVRLNQNYAYVPGTNMVNEAWNLGTRYLESLSVNGEIYSFSYSRFHNCGVLTDFWGYETSPVQFEGFPYVPQHIVPISLGASSTFCDNRESTTVTIGNVFPGIGNDNPESLLSIVYPTGGCVRFYTERHRYLDTDNVIRPVGGMRIARIDWHDNPSSAPVRQKFYRYGVQENGCGTLKIPLDVTAPYGNCYTEQRLKYYHTPVATQPTQYAIFGSERKRSYLPHPTFSPDCGAGSWVRYSQVAEYDTEDGSLSGKTVYYYDTSSLIDKVYRPAQSVGYPLEEHYWDIGMLDSVVYYRRQADGSFAPSRPVSYTYREHQEQERIYQGRVWASSLAVPVGFGDPDDFYFDEADFHKSYSEFIHNCNSMAVGCMQTLSEVNRIYETDGTVRTSVTLHEYDNPDTYFRPTSTTVAESDGRVVTVRSVYASDYNGTTSDMTSILYDKNIISTPLERIEVRDGIVTSAVLNIYDPDGYVVKSYSLDELGVQASDFRLSNSTEPGVGSTTSGVFNPDYSLYRLAAEAEYDNLKRLREIRITGESPISYLWSYNSIYPVAEIINATRTQVDAIPNSISTYPTDASLRAFFSTLRSGLPAAAVNGYTYNMLIGISSVTDPSGRTTYYEYDSNGRLTAVRDGSGNLQNTYEYNLKNIE